MSLQANRYLVYLGRDEDNHVTHDDSHHRPPRPPSMHYSTSLQRSDRINLTSNLSQRVPNSTPLAQSTPRSMTQLPSSTTISTTEHSRQSQYQTINNTSNHGSPNYMTSMSPNFD